MQNYNNTLQPNEQRDSQAGTMKRVKRGTLNAIVDQISE